MRLNPTELHSLFARFVPLRRKPARFFLAALSVLAATVLTILCQFLLGSLSALIFAVTVIACTTVLGLVAGLFAAVAATFGMDFFFLPPVFEFSFDWFTWRVGLAFLVLALGTHWVERKISARVRSTRKTPLGMRGSVDGIVDGELYGWAFDADHPENPVTVTVLLDKHPVADVAPVYYRPDVAQAMQCSGRYGFHVDLSPYFPKERDVWLDVRLPNGDHVRNTPTRMLVPAAPARKEKPTVLFMHIPKTAGTAFREAIAGNFRQSEIAYLYPGPPGFPVPDLRMLPLEQRRAFRVVIGHYQFGVHEALPQRSDYVTVVRHPAARVLSQYAYFHQTQPEILASDGEPLTLLEVFEKQLTVDFDNAIVRCFSGVDQREFPPGQLTRAIFERALQNLRENFTFVGHQEDSSKAYAWLCRHYGWSTVDVLPKVNLGARKGTDSVSVEIENAIRHYNQWDFLLYEEILKLFPRGESLSTSSVK